MTLQTAADIDRGLAVWRFAGNNSDADWQRYIDTITDLDARCPTEHRGAGLTVFVGKSPPPSPRWLHAIAAGTTTLRMHQPLFALVSERLLVRGMVTAINRIRTAPYESNAYRKLDAALGWLDAERGEAISPRLRELLTEVG